MKDVLKITGLLLVLFVNLTGLCNAQDLSSPESTVQSLFDGMRKGDSTIVSACFHRDITLHSTFFDKSGRAQVRVGESQNFLSAVGTPHDQVWDERISNLSVKKDGPLASAWMDYSFYLDDKFSHCGVNSMHFILEGAEWKIFQLMDTRRKKDCRE